MLASCTNVQGLYIRTIPEGCHGEHTGEDTLIIAVQQPSEACKASNAKKQQRLAEVLAHSHLQRLIPEDFGIVKQRQGTGFALQRNATLQGRLVELRCCSCWRHDAD